MTATSSRIRWYGERENDRTIITGHVGTLGDAVFTILPPLFRSDDWVLMSMFPGAHGARHADDPETLKDEAETWLAEFAAALGAVFPEPAGDPGHCEEQAETAGGLDRVYDAYGREVTPIDVRVKPRELDKARECAESGRARGPDDPAGGRL